MPRFYQYAGQPRKYNATARIYGQGARASETTALGSRYLGPVPESDLGPIPPSLGRLYGDLGRTKYFGGQLNNYVSNFGGQNKDLGAAMLSDNEKRLVMIGVIGLVGWFFLGPKIKKAMK